MRKLTPQKWRDLPKVTQHVWTEFSNYATRLVPPPSLKPLLSVSLVTSMLSALRPPSPIFSSTCPQLTGHSHTFFPGLPGHRKASRFSSALTTPLSSIFFVLPPHLPNSLMVEFPRTQPLDLCSSSATLISLGKPISLGETPELDLQPRPLQ